MAGGPGLGRHEAGKRGRGRPPPSKRPCPISGLVGCNVNVNAHPMQPTLHPNVCFSRNRGSVGVPARNADLAGLRLRIREIEQGVLG
eukprot:COSAG03_NODE_2083_length_3148_cov_2.934405_5_plen_87_part_00